MNRPAYGLSLPCRLHHVRDGDTVVVTLPGSDRQWALRLVDCWCPELRRGSDEERERGRQAAQAAEALCLANRHTLSVFVPAPQDALNLLGALTFDRVPAVVYLTDRTTLNGELVRLGHATAEKRPAA